MSTAPIAGGLARVVTEMVKDKPALDSALANQVAGAIAKNFKVKPDNVALLRLASGGKQLEFVVPDRLARIGTIPMSSTNSLAVRTARERRAEFINNFAAAVHHTVFEAVRLGQQRDDPIQKIVSVPVVVEGKAVGVIQVSRKGKSASAAGADFATKDVEELNQVAAALAKGLQAG